MVQILPHKNYSGCDYHCKSNIINITSKINIHSAITTLQISPYKQTLWKYYITDITQRVYITHCKCNITNIALQINIHSANNSLQMSPYKYTHCKYYITVIIQGANITANVTL